MSDDELKEKVKELVDKIDDEELLNDLGAFIQIAKKYIKLGPYLIDFKYKDINIDINDNVIDEIVNKCEFYEFGARRIDKIISKDIENFIIDGVIRGDKDIYIDSIVKKNITS